MSDSLDKFTGLSSDKSPLEFHTDAAASRLKKEAGKDVEQTIIYGQNGMAAIITKSKKLGGQLHLVTMDGTMGAVVQTTLDQLPIENFPQLKKTNE